MSSPEPRKISTLGDEQRLSELGISGSLRRGSYNPGLPRTTADTLPSGVTPATFDLADVPLFNADVESLGDPDPVTRLKDAIRRTDSVISTTPEYNHGPSGVLIDEQVREYIAHHVHAFVSSSDGSS